MVRLTRKASRVRSIHHGAADGWGFEVGDQAIWLRVRCSSTWSVRAGQRDRGEDCSRLLVLTPETTLELEGGQFEVKVAYKGNGAFFEIADETKSWITYDNVTYKAGTKTIFEQNPADTATSKLTVAPNTLDKRLWCY